jgi:phosphatidylserine decarboxylase
MKIHREGKKIIFITISAIFLIVLLLLLLVKDWNVVHYLFVAALIIFGFMVVAFFRIPRRIFADSPNEIISPADGTLVTIEQVTE